jgi:phospholipid/cholesterol/gamma-HCH transport system substrate-binding protein
MVAQRRNRWYRRPVLLGAVLLVLVLVALFSVYQKEKIGTWLASGSEVKADFARSYRLVPNKSDVKMAGVVVGTVTDVQKGPNGTSEVSMKVDDDAAQKLGSAPSATIRPTTLLGGRYYLEVQQGGSPQHYDGDTIPVSRTHIPVELDQILAAIPTNARDSIQKTTKLTDEALSNGAGKSLGDVLDHSPDTLRPAGTVLKSAQGSRPDHDLWQLVPNLNTAAVALTEQRGQLGHVLDALRKTSGALSNSRTALTSTIGDLPDTLTQTNTGLRALGGSLDRLNATAVAARPAVQQLDPVLAKAEPVLSEARPLVGELRPVLREARPMVDELVPTAKDASTTLAEVKGPVMNRISGPVTKMVMSPWKGAGAYEGDGGNGHLFYQEVGYLAAHTANLSQYHNKNGAMLGLGLGAGVSSAGGNDPGTAKFLQSLGLLPGGGVRVLPPPDGSHDTYTPETPTAPGQGKVLPGPLGPVLPGLLGGSDSKGK